MTNQEDISTPLQPPINFVQEGMALGSKVGFRLAVLYAISGVFLVILLETLQGEARFLDLRGIGVVHWYELIQGAPIFFIAAFLILFVAVGPAAILGILTGMLLG